MRVPARAVTALITDSFVAAGLPDADAARCAELMTEADLTGADGMACSACRNTSGVSRRGGFNAIPNITVTKTAPATALVDGDNGMGHLVMTRAADTAVAIARDTGVGWVGVRALEPCGPAGLYAEMAVGARHDRALCRGRQRQPHGGVGRLGLAARHQPARHRRALGRRAVVLDMATTIVVLRHGEEIRAARAGHAGGLVRRTQTGAPITDPNRAREGLLLPIGGYKGSGLAIMLGFSAACSTAPRSAAM